MFARFVYSVRYEPSRWFVYIQTAVTLRSLSVVVVIASVFSLKLMVSFSENDVLCFLGTVNKYIRYCMFF